MAVPTNIKTLMAGNAVEWAKIEFKETWDAEASLKTICVFANNIDNWGAATLSLAFKGPLHQQLREALQYIRNSVIQEQVINFPDRAEADRSIQRRACGPIGCSTGDTGTAALGIF